MEDKPLTLGSPTRRSALVFQDKLESPDPIGFKDSTVIPAISQMSSPRQSIAVSAIPELDSYATSPLSASITGTIHWKDRLKRLNSSWIYTTLSLVLVLFTLFGDGIRLAATPKAADPVFNALFLVALVFFALDFLRLCVARREYLWSFAFILDLISTLTLLVEIEWIWMDWHKENQARYYFHIFGNNARVTSLTLRLIKFVRAIKLAQVLHAIDGKSVFLSLKSDSALREEIDLQHHRKSFERKMRIIQGNGAHRTRNSIENRNKTRHSTKPDDFKVHPEASVKKQKTFARLYSQNKDESFREELNMWDIPSESRVSKTITNRTLRLVFFVVFSSVAILPLFSAELFITTVNGEKYGLELLESVDGSSDFSEMLHLYIANNKDSGNLATLISLTYNGKSVWESGIDKDDLRSYERDDYRTSNLWAVFDLRTHVMIEALFDIAIVLFSCAILFISAMLVTSDFSSTVLFGVERMVVLIRKIAHDPLLLLSSSSSVDMQPTPICCCFSVSGSEYGSYEINLLEQALKKIGVMLALGLGNAGCEIITTNIKTAGRLDPMIPGRKVLATFCFIGIRSFDVLTDLMGEKLFVYVNKIAKVVHSSAEKYQGGINRNLGESFFLVWKFMLDDGLIAGARTMANPYSMSVRLKTALALICCIKTLVKVTRSSEMANYLGRAGMNAVGPFLGNQLSVGLHVGWGFEGPVGSAFKIDATYLSPHVNKAARLESATRQYEVHLLASEDFVARLDDEIRPFLRHIDTVLLKGTNDPCPIYTFDMDLHGLGVSMHQTSKAGIEDRKRQVKEAFEFNYFNVHELFTQSDKVKKLRSGFEQEFFDVHMEGMKHYIEGRWREAKEAFHHCLKLRANDGPTRNLLAFMERYRFRHPEDWAGIRSLGSK
jgi:class 3 adenylate cyclase